MGEGLNAGPFIFAAYGVALALMLGYTVWQVIQRKKLRQLEAAMKEGN